MNVRTAIVLSNTRNRKTTEYTREPNHEDHQVVLQCYKANINVWHQEFIGMCVCACVCECSVWVSVSGLHIEVINDTDRGFSMAFVIFRKNVDH